MAGALGLALGLVLFIFKHAIAKVFSQDPLVLLFISGAQIKHADRGKASGGIAGYPSIPSASFITVGLHQSTHRARAVAWAS